MDGLLEKLGEVLGPSGLIAGEAVRERRADWLGFTHSQARAWLRPSTTAETSAALRLCHEAGQAIVPAGGLTGLVRGAHAAPAEIVLSTERMNGIERIDPLQRTVQALAGTPLETVQKAAAEQGLKFALDLGSRGSCTIGGNIATNAGGIEVLRYGMMREQVLGLEAVLADGEVVSAMNPLVKNNTGYDLKQLFIGSEGTLGIVTRAVLRLHPAAQSRNTALLAADSFEAVERIFAFLSRKLGATLSGFEVMWEAFYRLAADKAAPLAPGHAHYILAESQGADRERDETAFLAALEQVSERGWAQDAVVARSEAQADALWAVRENVGAAARQLQPLYVYDVSLQIADMPGYLAEVEAGLSGAFDVPTRVVVFGHIGDGNLHLFVQAGPDAHRKVDSLVYAPLEARGGSISAEHGVGLDKRDWLTLTRNRSEIALMKRLKGALDPDNILNPGKLFELNEGFKVPGEP